MKGELSMKQRLWKSAVAFTLALTIVAGTSPINISGRGLFNTGGIVASAASADWTATNSLPTEAGEYKLTADVTLSATWNVNANITIDLNGHGIYKNSGTVIRVNSGTLTINDTGTTKHYFNVSDGKAINVNDTSGTHSFTGGYITGGTGSGSGGLFWGEGGGIWIRGGSVVMNGGTILGNIAGHGAGVCVYSGNFTMNGGTVCYNNASQGGGGIGTRSGSAAYNLGGGATTGHITINGGTVSHNYGGGVSTCGYCYGDEYVTINGGTITDNNGNGVHGRHLTISGAPVITGNDYGVSSDNNIIISGAPVIKDNVNRNLFVNKNQAIVIDGPLTNTTPIGVTLHKDNKPVFAPYIFTSGGADYSSNFISDEDYEVKVNGSDLEMFAEVEKYTVIYFGNNITDGRLISDDISFEAAMDKDVVLGNKTVYSMISNATAQDTMKFQYKNDDGWSASSEIAVITDPDTANLESQATILPNGDKVLVVKGEIGMVGVSFVADASVKNGTLSYFIQSGKSISAPPASENPVKEGYVFKCWENRKTGETYQAGETITAPTFVSGGDNVLVLNAVWERQSCTVTFDSDGGSSVAAATVAYNGTVTEPADPKKSGYSFAGWVVAEKSGSFAKGETFDFNTKITENLKLKAVWKHAHSYRRYPMDAPAFKGTFEEYYDRYLTTAHIKVCDSWDDCSLEAHHFDENGKCKDCGYQLSDSNFVTVVNLHDNTTKKIVKGATYTLTAPERDGNDVFDHWGYIIDNGKGYSVLSKERNVSFTVPKDDPMTKITVSAFYRVEITEPSVILRARPALAGQTKAIQFYADYQLPSGWKAKDFVMKVGDNDMLFYFKPDHISLWTGFRDTFLNMFGKKQLGGYYCFEKVDDSLSGKISAFFKATFSKIPVYYPIEDNVMDAYHWDNKTLADKMYEGKGVTVKDMMLMEKRIDSPGMFGYVTCNVIPKYLGYGLPKDDDHIFYAMCYLNCEDEKGNNHTYIFDAITATANGVANKAVVSNSKHKK